MGHNSAVSGLPISTSFPHVDGWSMDPRGFGALQQMLEWRRVRAFALHAYPLLLGGRNNRLGMWGQSPRKTVRYIQGIGVFL